MLHTSELARVAQQFGVSDEQVRRDHLLSHLLAVLSNSMPGAVIFFGGTALARTHLPDGRLSEDLDLVAVPRRSGVAHDLERLLANGVRREYGQLSWDPPLSMVRAAHPAVLRTADGLAVRVQLLDPTGYPVWPTERRELVQRYSDAPPAALDVPTIHGFAASKTAAWHDRRAPRDLYDLWGLAGIGALSAEAAAVFARCGPTGHPPRPWMFSEAPNPQAWSSQLNGQTRVAIGPAEALEAVRAAWEAAASSPGPGVS